MDQQVEVLNARTEVIFGGYKITQTSLDEATENSDGSWSVDEPLENGSTYRVISEIPQPTEEQLQSAGRDYPASVEERFLQLPEDTPEEVAATARKTERGYDTNNPYDTARAIEQYLLYDGGFTYNLDADYRRADRALEKFLGEDGDKEGFCTQFATSMALIARERGIPSRVVYGATQGEIGATDEYIVRGRNMHTWVEIYFPGIGWYPFDPTPGFVLPEAMESNAPRPAGPISQQDFLTPQSPASLREDNSQSPVTDRNQNDDPETTPTRESTTPVWPIVMLVPHLVAGGGGRQAGAAPPRSTRGSLPGPYRTASGCPYSGARLHSRLTRPDAYRAGLDPGRCCGPRRSAVQEVCPRLLGPPLFPRPEPGYRACILGRLAGVGEATPLAAASRRDKPFVAHSPGKRRAGGGGEAGPQNPVEAPAGEEALKSVVSGVIIFVSEKDNYSISGRC